MSRGIEGKIKINSFADLVGAKKDAVVNIPLEDLYEFSGHPFRVIDDEKMAETVESIREHGVLVPAIVRPRTTDGYEIISGHRRKRACELLEFETMPAIIKNYTDDEAVIAMVDSNIYRDDILPSEKARAYRMKFDALKHQGSKEGGHTLDVIAEKSGESSRTIHRYLDLSRLIDGLLDLVDKKRLQFISGVEISFLTEKEQNWVLEVIEASDFSVSTEKALKLKDYSSRKELSKPLIKEILSDEKPLQRSFTIKNDKLKKYFGESVSKEEIEETIFRLLDEWLEKGDC